MLAHTSDDHLACLKLHKLVFKCNLEQSYEESERETFDELLRDVFTKREEQQPSPTIFGIILKFPIWNVLDLYTPPERNQLKEWAEKLLQILEAVPIEFTGKGKEGKDELLRFLYHLPLGRALLRSNRLTPFRHQNFF